MKGLGLSLRALGFAVILVALLVMTLTLASFAGCFSFEVPEKKIENTFDAWNMETPDYHHYAWEGGEIFYAEAGNPERPRIILVHGSPGSWDNYLSFFGSEKLRRSAHLIAVDRPGFGKSTKGGAVPSLERQSRALGPLLENQAGEAKAVLVGHSLGGPVVVQMAVDYPEKVGGLVLVAPSIAPDLEKLRWYNHAASWWGFKWALPRPIKHSNEEILPLKDELERLEKEVHHLEIPVVVIQGEKDFLVPHKNADYVQETFTNADVEIQKYPDLNHFIPWTRPDLIEKALFTLLAQARESSAAHSPEP